MEYYEKKGGRSASVPDIMRWLMRFASFLEAATDDGSALLEILGLGVAPVRSVVQDGNVSIAGNTNLSVIPCMIQS